MQKISKESLKRLPSYLRYLTALEESGVEYVSSSMVAEYFNFTAIQVRKDLAGISKSGGKPKMGFSVSALIFDIKEYLGYENTNDAVIVGVGKLGSTLLGYEGFKNYGLNIVAAFDENKERDLELKRNEKVFVMEKLCDICSRLNILMGIITVPKNYAQEVCDKLISCGVVAIWNFAPVHLIVPDGIIVKNEDMGASLAYLSNKLNEKLREGNE